MSFPSSPNVPKGKENTHRNDHGDDPIVGVPTSSNGVNECIDRGDVLDHPSHDALSTPQRPSLLVQFVPYTIGLVQYIGGMIDTVRHGLAFPQQGLHGGIRGRRSVSGGVMTGRRGEQQFVPFLIADVLLLDPFVIQFGIPNDLFVPRRHGPLTGRDGGNTQFLGNHFLQLSQYRRYFLGVQLQFVLLLMLLLLLLLL